MQVRAQLLLRGRGPKRGNKFKEEEEEDAVAAARFGFINPVSSVKLHQKHLSAR